MTKRYFLSLLMSGLFVTVTGLASPGCGGGDESGTVTDVQAVGATNPAPEDVPIDQEFDNMDAAEKSGN